MIIGNGTNHKVANITVYRSFSVWKNTSVLLHYRYNTNTLHYTYVLT